MADAFGWSRSGGRVPRSISICQLPEEPRIMGDMVRILLVEDNPADVYLFRKALEEAELKFELMVIRSSEAALALVRGDGEYAACSVPDLAVLDVNLPKNDGIEVLEVIRATPRYAR